VNAVLLILGGITLIGIVTATMASWIVQRVTAEDTEHQAATAAEIDHLRSGLEQQIAMLRNEIRQMSDGLAAERNPP
jgi:voltage-gated potassium channel